MDTHHRIPLHDLPLEHFLIASKSPRKHKRPLSPSRTTPLNPAKRRVLDAEGILLCSNVVASSFHPVPFILSSMHSVTPTRQSPLGNGLGRSHAGSKATSSFLPASRRSPSHELSFNTAAESSVDPQSRHYPGFDIFRDNEHRRGSPATSVSLPSTGDVQVDGFEEDKENVPLKRKAKKLIPKKRILSGLSGSDASRLAQVNKVVRPERTPFSARQALR